MLKVSNSERKRWALDIRKRREHIGWSQEGLARKAEVSVAAVQKIERATAGGRAMYQHLSAFLNGGRK